MESIRNTVNSAARLAADSTESRHYVENNEPRTEPISGVTGRGTGQDPYDAGNFEDQPREGGAVTQPLTSGHGSGSLNRPIGNPSERYALENPGLSYGTVVDGSSRESNYERMEPSTSRTAYSASGVQGVSHGGDGSSTADRGFHNTPTAHQLDPRASDRSEGYSTLGSSSSRTAVDQPDFSTTTSMGTLSTGRARDTDGHTSYDRQRPVEDSTTSERLPGQRDTTSGPLGGIAQGGVARGINATGRVRPEHETEKTGVTGMHSDDAKFDVLNPSFANASSGAAEPSVGADPSSGQKSEQKQQGADRPHEVPSEEGLQAIREKKEAVEKTASGEGGANDLEKSGRGDVPGEQKSTEKGTGEKWVKSTGLAADGGDFDASKPGAGREADRLLDQKGIQRSPPPGTLPDTNASSHSSPSTSLGEKIKEKLHIGGHGS